MEFPGVDAAIDLCEEHLNTTSSRGTEVEAFLTRYLITVIYASYEAKIKELVAERGYSRDDEHLSRFMITAADRLCRSINISEVAGLLGLFGPDYKSGFQSRVHASMQIAYDNIINNRHGVAHEGNMNLTFDELRQSYVESCPVLDAIEDALELLSP